MTDAESGSGSGAGAGGARAGGGDFIRQIIRADVEAGRNGGRVVTRFPPEPNGYLHIGHAKSICLNFGVAEEFGGRCHLRFDDSNPETESLEYVQAIQEDVRWLGYDWGPYLMFASDYFEQLYGYAEHLIRKGLAYVCSLSPEEIRAWRGTLTEPGRESPYRNRTVEENLELFARMRAGEFPDGAHVLRARIDMASPNLNLRDPVLYRIRHATHYRTGDAWCIFPTYDFAHALSDAIEGVTHSLCTLEFEDHRPLYDWIVESCDAPSRPRQIEFSRLNLEYTVMSKRMLNALVREGHVQGWDDPRMPTLRGMRRRGYPPAAIRDFCDRVGVTRKENVIEPGLLESCVRDALEPAAPRAMAVLRPLRLVVETFPEGETDWVEARNHPARPELGTRRIPFTREILIERDDFMLDPPRKFFRLAPGREVRLRYGYIVRCESWRVDEETGEVVEVVCSHDPGSRGGDAPDGRKVRGTLHWVSARHAVPAQIRLYDRLFQVPHPAAERSRPLAELLNPRSLEILDTARVEPGLAEAAPGATWQFERLGYFTADERDSGPGRPVFNRTVTLRDTWARIARSGPAPSGGAQRGPGGPAGGG